MSKVRCCPICRGYGVETGRKSGIHDDKLVEYVTKECDHVFFRIRWTDIDDSIRDYPEQGRGWNGFNNYHRKMKQHPEHVADGQVKQPLQKRPVDVVPTANALKTLEEDESDWRSMLRRSVRKFRS